MKTISIIAVSTLFFLSVKLNAETIESSKTWAVDATSSYVNFVSIKKGNIAETHIFNDFSGSVIEGTASVEIKPDSVDSQVPIRNQRMRDFLFETGLYPTIVITADVSETLSKLVTGNSTVTTIPSTLTMHGVSKDLTLEVRISRLSPDTLIVANTQPVLIRASDFNMLEGITKLASLVNNLPIAESVPVNFSLQLERSNTNTEISALN